MDTIFMISKNNKTSDIYRLLLNLNDKINLKRNDKYITLSNLSIYYTWKDIKRHTNFIIEHGMKSLNYLMDHNLYKAFQITLNIS